MIDNDVLEAPATVPVIEPLYTLAELLAILKIGKGTLYKLFNTGQLAWVRVGGHRRVTHAELKRFLADNSSSAVA